MRILWIGLTLAALSGVALAQQTMPHGGMPMSRAAGGLPMMDMMICRETGFGGHKGYKTSMMKMMRDMPMTYTGNADVDFMRQMRAHHQGAIDMAGVVVAQGRDGEVKSLANKIIEDQRKEIAGDRRLAEEEFKIIKLRWQKIIAARDCRVSGIAACCLHGRPRRDGGESRRLNPDRRSARSISDRCFAASF